MRSAHPPPARRRRRGPTHAFLPAVAGIVDQATVDEPGHVLVHVDGPVHPEVGLGFKSSAATCTPSRCSPASPPPTRGRPSGSEHAGRAHHLDHPDAPPERTAVTFLVDRDGNEASVLRMGEAISEPAGPAVGTIPDVARRVLGVATSGATHVHGSPLDRDVARPGARALVPTRSAAAISTSSWGQIAVLHPAVHAPSPPDVVAFADPASLVSVGALARGGHLLGRRCGARRCRWRCPAARLAGTSRCGWTTASSPGGRSEPSPPSPRWPPTCAGCSAARLGRQLLETTAALLR